LLQHAHNPVDWHAWGPEAFDKARRDDKPIFPVAEKTKLGFRSRSVTKGGTSDFNEITLDDKKGSEEVFLHAQKDMKTEVENDQTLTVENDRTVTINKGNETVTLKQGDRSEVLALQRPEAASAPASAPGMAAASADGSGQLTMPTAGGPSFTHSEPFAAKNAATLSGS